MVGAWFGHVAASAGEARGVRVRQLPLATLMVVLTVTTLWSLGQAIIAEPKAEAGAPRAVVRELDPTAARVPRAVVASGTDAVAGGGRSGRVWE
jgi:hypothetical protein